MEMSGSYMLWPLSSKGRSPLIHIDQEAVWVSELVWICGEKTSVAEFEPWSMSSWPATLLTTLSQLNHIS